MFCAGVPIPTLNDDHGPSSPSLEVPNQRNDQVGSWLRWGKVPILARWEADWSWQRVRSVLRAQYMMNEE